MAAGIVQLAPDQSGKKVQMAENTISGNIAEAQYVAVISSSGMSNSYVQVAADSTGKKIQYFSNIIGGQTVYAQALVRVDSSGTAL